MQAGSEDRSPRCEVRGPRSEVRGDEILSRSVVIALLLAVAWPLFASEGEVRQAVATFGKAYRAADVETLAGMLTDDYVHTNSSSAPIEREAWLGWVASRRAAIDAGTLSVVEYENADLEVVVHGDAAVVTGTNRTVSIENGERRESKLRFTMLWVKAGGEWKRAAFQDCRM